MISVQLSGYLGNHLWQYSVCRVVAEKLGFDFHIPRNFIGSEIFECNIGTETKIVNNVFPTVNAWNCDQKYDQKIFEIQDFTELQGHFQAEKYIFGRKDDIKEWFKFKKDHSELDGIIHDDVCVIHFRGGDYKSFQRWYLPYEYYANAKRYILNLNPNTKFVVVTNDVVEAKMIFNDPIYNIGLSEDFYLVANAKYVITANSSFSWWGAWINKRVNVTVSPKYWLLHKDNNGVWFPADAITDGFIYLDVDGRSYTSRECASQFSAAINYTDKYWSF